jgi:hypothetical protein
MFGSPNPIAPEPVLPILKASFDHSVQEVRTEALQVTVELHSWLGSSLDAAIQGFVLPTSCTTRTRTRTRTRT